MLYYSSDRFASSGFCKTVHIFLTKFLASKKCDYNKLVLTLNYTILERFHFCLHYQINIESLTKDMNLYTKDEKKQMKMSCMVSLI